MRVRHLSMKSYRGIGNLELDFPVEGPVALIGINGSGKTSVLNCIAKLLISLTNKINGQDDSSKRIFDEEDIALSSEDDELKNEIVLEYSIEAIQKSWDNKDKTLTFSGGLFVRPKATARNDLRDLDPFSRAIQSQLDKNHKFNLPIMAFYPVDRALSQYESLATKDGRPPSRRRRQQLVAYENSLVVGQAKFSDFFHWFLDRENIENEYRISNDPGYRDPQLEAIRSAVSKLLDGFSGLRIRRLPYPRMIVSKQGFDLDVSQLSDGEKCLLAMVGDLARRLAIANPGLDDSLQGDGIVLIDELELHLHPEWQRHIIKRLTDTFPRCQFIVTTHSPQVVSEIQSGNIYILEPSEKGVDAYHPEFSYGRDSNQILEEIMDVPERPRSVKEELNQLFRLIEAGDLVQARKMQRSLEHLIGDDDSEFVKADILIRRREVLGR